MTSELKPCPFCGEEVDMYDSNSKDLSYFVSCFPCEISIGKNLRTKKAAMTAWNARAVPDVPELVRYAISNNGGRYFGMAETLDGKYVRYDQAAAVIAAKDVEIQELKEKLGVVSTERHADAEYIGSLKAEIDRLRGALAFYADKSKWDSGGFEYGASEDGGHNVLTLITSDIDNDQGCIARAALSGKEPS